MFDQDMTTITRTTNANQQAQMGGKTNIVVVVSTEYVRDNLDKDFMDMEQLSETKSDDDDDERRKRREDILLKEYHCEVDQRLQKEDKIDPTKRDDNMNSETHTSANISQLLESHL